MNYTKFIIFALFILSIILLIIVEKPNYLITKEGGPWTIGYGEIDGIDDVNKILEKNILKKEIESDTLMDFIADPFLFKDSSGIYIFAEHVFKDHGDISVFHSEDTIDLNFKYLGVGLDENFHLSYPQVFKYNNEMYMLPETQRSGSVILYKSEDFPLKWRPYKKLLNYDNIKDPTILNYDNKLYLFV
jgi:hypothetical protein